MALRKYHYHSNYEQILIPRIEYKLTPLREDAALVPRFTLKGGDIFPDFPTNEPIKFDKQKLIKAIQYGMIVLILYKGEEDGWKGGRERTIYPMVLGRSEKGDLLLRGYHLKGWSVSEGRTDEKIWRMFRADRIKSMTFTGSFFRLPPSGYNMDDKGMRGGIIARADFSQIRAKQQQLVNSRKVNSPADSVVGSQGGVPKVILEDTKSELNLQDPWSNQYISKKDAPNIRVCVLKPMFGGNDIMVLGVLGTKGNTARIYEGDHQKGVYKVVDSFMADELDDKKIIDGKSTLEVYAFKEMTK